MTDSLKPASSPILPESDFESFTLKLLAQGVDERARALKVFLEMDARKRAVVAAPQPIRVQGSNYVANQGIFDTDGGVLGPEDPPPHSPIESMGPETIFSDISKDLSAFQARYGVVEPALATESYLRGETDDDSGPVDPPGGEA
jgi:hypothetical protein